jgi:hypothetical protein
MGDHPIGEIATGFQLGQASFHGLAIEVNIAGRQQGTDRSGDVSNR